MPFFAVTANLLMSFALYAGVVAALYGGTDVAATATLGAKAPVTDLRGGGTLGVGGGV